MTRAFCTTPLDWGSSVKFTGHYIQGRPEVIAYDGDWRSFCGVSNNAVVNLDLTRHPLREFVPVGGLIDVIQRGEIRIPTNLLINPKDLEFNSYIKPTGKGSVTGMWKAQKCRTKKSVGHIVRLGEYDFEVQLI